jgi:hypothetical protein
MSAHLIDIDDKDGQVVDRNYYCSDTCAKTDEKYNGWNGCHEIFTWEICENCSKELVWYDEEEKTYKIGSLAIGGEHAGYWSLWGTYLCYSCGAYCETLDEDD